MTFTTDEFHTNKAGKKLTAEISELQGNHFAASGGFRLKSVKTGHYSDWNLITTKRDANNDITSWEFEPTLHTLERFPTLLGWTITIFND